MQQQVPTMQKITAVLSVLAVTWTTCLWSSAALAATPNDPDQAHVDELQHQVDALNQDLTRLKGVSDPVVQRQGMQRHWSMMQNHMRSVRKGPGMQAEGCRDWMMMDPSAMGPGMMGPGMMGKGMMDCPMMGHGMGHGGMWGMPSNMNPGQYHSQMQGHMAMMRNQMAAIAAEKDPTKRNALLRAEP